MLRRHLGICYDVCHGAVEYEDIVAALDRLLAAGIAVPKVQFSAAMRVPVMTHDLIAAVMRYNDGVYLHQTIVRRDEGLVAARRPARCRRCVWRRAGRRRVANPLPRAGVSRRSWRNQIDPRRSCATLAAFGRKPVHLIWRSRPIPGTFCRTIFEPARRRPTSPVRSRSASRNWSDECCRRAEHPAARRC